MDTTAKNKAYWRKNCNILPFYWEFGLPPHISARLCSWNNWIKFGLADVHLGSISPNKHPFGFSLHSSSSMPG